MFSSRSQWKLESNRLAKKLLSFKKRGVRVLDLTESNPTHVGLSYPKEIIGALNFSSNLDYRPDPKGLIRARKQIARYYAQKGTRINPEEIILTSSTSESYSYLLRLLANPGDEVLVPEPSYPLFEYLASLNDVVLKSYRLNYETRWHLDVENLKGKVSSKTRAILLVHPNNPTGNFVKPSELAALNQIARQKNIALICDEVFLDYAFGENQKIKTLAGNRSSLTFTLSGVSKVLGLPQMKLGWIVVSGPKHLKREAISRLEIIADTYLSVSTLVQNALPAWFGSQSKIQKQIQDRIIRNQKSIRLPDTCELLHAEGGWYAVIRIPRIHSEEEWVMKFLEKDHVWVQPGYFFDFDQEAYLVVSLLTPEKIFKEGMRRISRRIQNE